MKNIRKYLIYFTICLVSLFAFSNFAKADTVFNLDYENYSYTTRLNIYEELKTYIDEHNTNNLKYLIGYFYNTANSEGTGYFVYILNANYSNSIDYVLSRDFVGKYSGGQDAINSLFYFHDSNTKYILSSTLVGNFGDRIFENNYSTNKTNFFNKILAYLNNPNSNNSSANYNGTVTGKYHFSRGSISYNTNFNYYFEFYYSSLPIYYVNPKTNIFNSNTAYNDFNDICSSNFTSSDVYDTTIYYNNGLYSMPLTCGDSYPTYLNYIENQVVPNISVAATSYRYTEEDNNFIYKKIVDITFNDDYVNENYKLSYKYTDSLLNVKTGVLSGNNDSIDIYLNGTLEIYIKDSSNEIIDSYSATYNDLGELSQRAAFDSNGNGNNLYSLNVHYNFGSMRQYGVMPFRIMYYSNDFSDTNTPRLLGFKKYYYDSNNSKKVVANDFDLYDIKDLECKKYSNQVICNGYIINSLPYNNFEIDFIFNHIENYSMHYFDQFTQNFSARDITVLSNDLVGYTKYYFPTNSDKAYIFKKHLNQNVKTGSVIFPWYYTENETINMKAIYYSPTNTFNFLPILSYQNNPYYKKIDFDLTDNEVLTVLVDRVNTCSTDSITNLGSTLAGIKLPKLNISCNYDSAYIFVPNDFIVNFNQYTSEESYQVLTDDDGNKTIINKEFNNKNFYNTNSINSLFERVTNELNNVAPLTREFGNTLNLMWNKISPERQSLITTCFCMIVIISIVLMARRG